MLKCWILASRSLKVLVLGKLSLGFALSSVTRAGAWSTAGFVG